MLRKLLFSMVTCLIFSIPAFAQSGSINGKITDFETTTPIVGANVYIPSLQIGASSDIDGNYTVNNIPAGTYTLRVTYVGYKKTTRQVNVTSGTTTVNIQLNVDLIGLGTTVITAQQIQKNKRELGYSVSQVSSKDLNKAKETNFVDALAGKVPGVTITNQSGNIGGSSRIVIRGASSLTGNNQPLFVVDGVPVSNSNIVGGTSQDRLTGAIDVGNRGSDLNPDDIANVSVLKGAAAAALYGQRARNGVILITTKKGNSASSVKISSTIRTARPLRLPDFQNEYGAGARGKYGTTSLNGWGPKIEGQQVENFQMDTVNLQAYPDNVKDFYDNAVTAINSISVSDGDETSDFRLGYTRQDQGGIIPNSELNKNTLTFNTGRTLTDDFTARISGSYVNTTQQGKAVAGGNDPNVLTSLINTIPRTFDISGKLSDYQNPDGTQKALTTFTNNPYWLVNKNIYSSTINRLYGSGRLQYDFAKYLSVKLRVGTDFYTEQRQNINAVGTKGREDGAFSEDVIRNFQADGDLILSYQQDLNESFNLKALAGTNINTRRVQIQNNQATTLTVPGLYNFANAQSNAPGNSFSQQRIVGFYGDVTLGYNDYLFLELTGRNDISSTLPKSNRSYFYPSANLSFIFTDALDIDSGILSYGKLRANYAVVGNDAGPYQLDFSYFPVSTIFGQYGTGNNFPYGGQTGFVATGTIPPTNLKPEKTYSFEFGTELQFFDGKFGIDATYYNIHVKDEILSIPIPQSTGFGGNRKNVGEVSNKGLELAVNATPVRNRNFNWSINANFSKNVNNVEKLAPGVQQITVASAFNSLQVKAQPGQSFGLYGVDFKRSPNGKPVIDPQTGLRQSGDLKRLGSIDQDFKVGFSSDFNYKSLGLSFLLDWKQGGVIYSETVRSLRASGVAEETAANRGGTFIDDGVIEVKNAQGDVTGYRPNDVPVQSLQAFWGQYSNASIQAGSIFPATYVKLRELKLSYNFSRNTLESTPFHDISVSLVGRNLFLLYSEIPHIDPETGLFGSASNGQGIEYNNLPSVRSFGVNVSFSL